MKLKVDPSEPIVLDALQSPALHHWLMMLGDEGYIWGQVTEVAFLDYVAPFLFNRKEYVRTAAEFMTLEVYAGAQNSNLLNKINYK